jgi:hypothetical protein
VLEDRRPKMKKIHDSSRAECDSSGSTNSAGQNLGHGGVEFPMWPNGGSLQSGFVSPRPVGTFPPAFFFRSAYAGAGDQGWSDPVDPLVVAMKR